MSIAVNTSPTRDIAEGFLSLRSFKLNADLALRIEEHFDTEPPSMFVDCTGDDVILSFALGEAFSQGGTVGPCWRFSLREALRTAQDFGSNSEVIALTVSMDRLTAMLADIANEEPHRQSRP
jgi:hypothetical protein